MRAKLATWFDDRTGWGLVRERLEARAVVSTFELHLVALGLALLALLVASGVLLMMHYRPSAGEAHLSVVRIDGAVPFGALVRGVHAWSSDGLVAVTLVYAFGLLVRRGYRRPNELLWVGAWLGAFVVTALAFSGALLPWTDAANLHARVAASAAGEMPLMGSWLRRLLLGGADATDATLPRAFGFHVAVLPALLTLLLVVQAALASRGPKRPADEGMPLYPDAALRVATMGVCALFVTVTLATFVPHAGEVARPPWYLASLHDIAGVFPPSMLGIPGARVLAGVASILAVMLLALPFLDPRGSRLVAYLGWILIAALVALTIHAMV